MYLNFKWSTAKLLPLSLRLSNFLSWQYMPTPLDLTGIGLACLCGDNGHGKSALLDATTWVLWGESRAERQEDLIYQGAREMSVELEFLAQDQRYKAIRKHISSARGRQGKTELELLHLDGPTQTPITGNSVKHTENIIKELLNMDYSTFINTSFLMQGKADQFATAKPTERKNLLGDVLDLHKYDRISDRARVKARACENNANRLSGELERLDTEISEAPTYHIAAKNASDILQQVNTELDAAQTNVLTLQEQSGRHREELMAMEQAISEISILIKELEQNSHRRTQLWKRINNNKAILDSRTEIEHGYANWQKLLYRSNELETKREAYERLAQQKREVEQEIELEKQRLISFSEILKEQISGEFEPRVAAISIIETSINRLSIRQTSLEKEQLAINQISESLSELSDQIQLANILAGTMSTSQKETNSRIDLISAAEAICPVCGEVLNEGHRQEISIQLKLEQQVLIKKIHAIKNDLQNLTNKESRLTNDVRERQSALNNQKRKIDTAATEAQINLLSAKEAAVTLSKTISELENINLILETGAYAEERKSQLHLLSLEIKTLAYAPKQHHEINIAMQQNGDKYHQRHAALQYAADAISTDQEIYEELTKRNTEYSQKLEAHKTRSMDEHISPEILKKSIALLKDAVFVVDQLQQKSKSVSLDLQKATWQLTRIEALGTTRETLIANLDQLNSERNVFQELSTTFGKNGLQAYMIDEALPELEFEASELLSKLTNNRMSVRLETQRERRSSKGLPPRETLDILVADEKGTRPYELFSGGEAFRVNFSLRIALSRMLARRAGSPLPTLFIDEGFGTQDAEGKSLLIESINAIREDFKCILVVTHIDEIKDAFPFRIEIIKTEETGSTFQIN
jgi:exonuclease SbcC